MRTASIPSFPDPIQHGPCARFRAAVRALLVGVVRLPARHEVGEQEVPGVGMPFHDAERVGRMRRRSFAAAKKQLRSLPL